MTRANVLILLAILVTIGGLVAWLEGTGTGGFAKVADEKRRDAAAMGLDSIRMGLTSAYLERGVYPASLADLPPHMLTTLRVVDPWGQEVRYERHAPDAYELCSAGPDARFGSDDDICGSSRVPAATARQ